MKTAGKMNRLLKTLKTSAELDIWVMIFNLHSPEPSGTKIKAKHYILFSEEGKVSSRKRSLLSKKTRCQELLQRP